MPETATKIDAGTTVGAVHLTVADLERSIPYYAQAIGLSVLSRDAGTVSLGVPGGEPLLVLVEESGAQPVRGHTGLFHFALLLPDRPALARWLVHAANARVPLSGMSDHLVSEAIYLRDPDFHGIEIYRDRPRSEWPGDGRGGVEMATIPLDTDALIGALDGDPASAGDYEGMPGGTTMGHVHLHVADIGDTERFYRDVMGFDVMAHMPEATFLSAGGYHHHLGANVWAGRGASPPPPGSAALRHATIVLPDAAERDRVAGRIADAGQEPEAREDGVLVRDPGGNALLLVTPA
jgi:catechol 2,3-dioxygenase